MIGNHVRYRKSRDFIQHGEPAGGRAAIAVNIGHDFILHHVA